MIETWNEICYELKTCIKNNVLEKDYEKAVSSCITLLGWKKSKGEITTQYTVQVGHEKKFADIVISKDDKEQFVIEIKRPNHTIKNEDEEQLFSYMRLLKHQVNCGIYIGEKIYLYYDNLKSRPKCILSIEICENNPNGVKFVELFSRNNFTSQKYIDFCKEQEELISKQEYIKTEIEKICNDNEGYLIKDLIRKRFIDEGCPNEYVDTELKKLKINITYNTNSDYQEYSNINNEQETFPKKQEKKGKDNTHYSILGNKPLGKGRFVLEVVKRYVKNNPKTYNEYDRIFNSLRKGSYGVIKTIDEAKTKTKKGGGCSYFIKENECLTSSDGIIFAVCVEWSINNIQPIIDFANKIGLEVKSI